MRNVFLFIFLNLISLGLVNSQNFKEIYSFEIGNIFQYNEAGTAGESDIYYYGITEKYKIVNKETNGDTLKYSILGRRLDHAYYYDGFMNKVDLYNSASDIIDTIIYIDSTSNFLNKPVGSLVLVNPPFGGEDFYTRILIENSEEMEKKIIGGSLHDEQSNMFKNNGDTVNLDTISWDNQIFTTTYKLKFSEGLGLVEEDYWGFEYGYTKTLVGFVKGNDTTGLITPDEQFTDIRIVQNNQLKIYPNPSKDYLNIIVGLNTQIESIVLYDLNGREIENLQYKDRIFVGYLRNGLYWIRLTDSQGRSTVLKFIKE